MIGRRTSSLRLLSLVLVVATTLSCQERAPKADIGMTVHSRGADAASIAQQFDLMADMGVTWIRVDIDWSVAESTRGQFDWTYPDVIAEQATARGMNVLAVLTASPAWARPSVPARSATAHYSRAESMSDWAAFARNATQRYSAKGVHHWEIWNEPNTSKFWPSRPDVNEYGTLFWVAADAVRSVDPQATVLIGGLSPKFDVPDAETAPVDYLEQLYANGAAQRADGVSVHPYTFPALPMDAPQRMIGGFAELPELRAVMDRHGDGSKKIWITEFGAPTGTGEHAVSEDDQAAAFLQARDQVEQWEWAGPLIYYELVDGGEDLTDTEQNFGVLHEDLSPKPAADALMDSASS